MPGAVRDRGGGREVNRGDERRAIIEAAQPAVLHEQRPAIAAAVLVFADNALHGGHGVGGAKPAHRGEREGIQIVRVRHPHVAVHAVEFKRVDGHLIEHDGRAGRNPRRIAEERTEEAVPRGVASRGAAVFVEMPQRQQAVFITVELPVLEIIDFGNSERAVPKRYFVNRAEKAIGEIVIAADLERLGARR